LADLDVVGAIVQASVDDEDFLMVERVEIPGWKLGLVTWSDNRSAVWMTRRLEERDSTPVADVLCLIFLFLKTKGYLVNSITFLVYKEYFECYTGQVLLWYKYYRIQKKI